MFKFLKYIKLHIPVDNAKMALLSDTYLYGGMFLP